MLVWVQRVEKILADLRARSPNGREGQSRATVGLRLGSTELAIGDYRIRAPQHNLQRNAVPHFFRSRTVCRGSRFARLPAASSSRVELCTSDLLSSPSSLRYAHRSDSTLSIAFEADAIDRRRVWQSNPYPRAIETPPLFVEHPDVRTSSTKRRLQSTADADTRLLQPGSRRRSV